MCWYSNNRNIGGHITRIALRNIPVYKIVEVRDDGNVVPLVYSDKLTYGTVEPDGTIKVTGNGVFECEMKIDTDDWGIRTTNGEYVKTRCISCSVAMHSLSRRHKFRVDDNFLHCNHSSIHYTFWNSRALMKCVIPAGTRYRVNDAGEYVSDRIRVEEIKTLNGIEHLSGNRKMKFLKFFDRI